MNETFRFRILAWITALACVLGVGYNILSETYLPEIEGYFKRRAYYETSIKGRGLSLEPAKYWEEK